MKRDILGVMDTPLIVPVVRFVTRIVGSRLITLLGKSVSLSESEQESRRSRGGARVAPPIPTDAINRVPTTRAINRWMVNGLTSVRWVGKSSIERWLLL